jgi:hypothetical protein
VYRAFVLLATDGSLWSGGSDERYVVVDLSQQMAWAMEGEAPVRAMAITTGAAGFETPVGEFRVQARVERERMTSASAGFGPDEYYDVQRVLFTQYFAAGGFALHLNYWQPDVVFGSSPTSHGCIGLRLADAQFLWLFGEHGMRVIIRQQGGSTPAPLPTQSPTPASSPTATPTASPSPTPLASPTAAAPNPTPSASPWPPATPSATTVTPTPSADQTGPTPTPSPVAPSETLSPSPTMTGTATPTATASMSPE